MENYYTIGQVPSDAFVNCMLIKIVPRHLNKVKQYQSIGYLEFREKLVEVFKEPDMATDYLNVLIKHLKTQKRHSMNACPVLLAWTLRNVLKIFPSKIPGSDLETTLTC